MYNVCIRHWSRKCTDVIMIQELIAARDGFKISQNLYKNEIIDFIVYISNIDVI